MQRVCERAVAGWSWHGCASSQGWVECAIIVRVHMNLVGSFELVCSTGAIETDLSQ